MFFTDLLTIFNTLVAEILQLNKEANTARIKSDILKKTADEFTQLADSYNSDIQVLEKEMAESTQKIVQDRDFDIEDKELLIGRIVDPKIKKIDELKARVMVLNQQAFEMNTKAIASRIQADVLEDEALSMQVELDGVTAE